MNFQDELKKWANALGAERPEVKDILQRAALFREEKYLRLLKKQCDREGIDLSNPPAYTVPSEVLIEGIPIGNVLHGDRAHSRFCLPHKAILGGHSIFTGATGTGKSTLLMCLIIPALITLGILCLIWDVGRQYGSVLCSLFPSDKVIRFRPNEFMINPLIPPGRLSHEAWCERFASMWRILDCGPGMIGMLKEAISYVYANYSVPTLLHIRDRIQNLSYKSSERHFNWRESLLDRIDFILSALGEGFICERGFMQGELHRSIIFDMEGTDPLSYAFYMDLINERILHGQRDSFSTEARIVEVVEEAHIRLSRDALARRATEIGERLILTHIRMAKKIGLNFIFVDQVPHMLPEQLFANILTWVVFRLTDARSLDRVQDILNLDDDQRQAIASLPNRRAVVFSQL